MDVALAELVWERARRCCEYCRMPQIHDELLFEIDHVVAEQQHGSRDSRPPTAWPILRRQPRTTARGRHGIGRASPGSC